MNKLHQIAFIIIFSFTFFIIKILTFFFRLISLKDWFPKKEKSVLYFENFPIENAGYQYRAKIWSDILCQKDYYSKVKTTIKDKSRFEELLKHNVSYFYIISIFIRFLQLLSSVKFQTIIVRRELLQYNDYGNLFMEKLLFSLHCQSNVILDFDDNILEAKEEGRKISTFGRMLGEKNNKFTESIKMYSRFIVCSSWHVNFINSINTNSSTLVIPTCVELDNTRQKDYSCTDELITIGWIGGNGNQKYLDMIIDDLNIISNKYKIELLVISGAIYRNNNSNFTINNIKWSLQDQEIDLLKIDIGIMPLPLDEETKGKCGFKLLQYMALGIVSIASPVGINREIIKNGVNGYLAENSWLDIIEFAIRDKRNWTEISSNAIKTIELSYSFSTNMKKYVDFLK